jgi:arylsulfatase A-like enzyme
MLVVVCPVGAAPRKPNIVVILADDLGNADLGYRGGQVKTPAIDRLAQGGVRFESFYTLPLCTPGRAALMTGRYPMRYGLQTLVIFPSHTYGLATDERTLAQALKEAGYQTYMVGKWHLGHAYKKYWPQNRGFDHFYGNLIGEVDYYTKERGGVIDWQRDGKFLNEKGYYMTQIGDEAVRIINNQDKSKPFFLYFASLAVHTPYEAPKSIEARYPEIKDPTRRTYAAMASALDDQVARIVAALEKRGMRKDTVIVFASDNGGVAGGAFAKAASERKQAEGRKATSNPASNAPFRGGKGTLYEGGVRVPAFVNWPGHLAPKEVDAVVDMVDVMPTLLGLAGAKGSPTHPFDGKDLWPVMAEGKASPHDDILLNVESWRGAVRKGRWKLIRLALLPGNTELFDIEADPRETTNVAAQHPDIVRELDALLLGYARQQKLSLWLQAQPAFIGVQGKSVLDPSYDVDDGGLPHEKTVLPK